jgi:hypothetical protein
MPKEPPALASRQALLRRALEILRVVWSDQPPCEARSHNPMSARQMYEDVTRTPAAPPANEAVTRAQRRRTIARALDHQAAPRRHLSVTTRWIELQQQRGLPHIHTPGMNRYRISEVEAWLREQYGWAQSQ